MTRRGLVAAGAIVLLGWSSASPAATIWHGATGPSLGLGFIQVQLRTEYDRGSIRSLGGRGQESASYRATARVRRYRTQSTHALLMRVCVSCQLEVAPQPSPSTVLVAPEREERKRLVPARALRRAARRPGAARAVLSTQLQASRDGESDLRTASARQDVPYSATQLRAPPSS